MKKIFQKICLFFKNFKRKRNLNEINKKLEKAVESKQKERLVLSYKIVQMVKKYTKSDKNNVSKYIPLDEATKAEIRFQVDLKFGEEMAKLNVKLNNKLQIV